MVATSTGVDRQLVIVGAGPYGLALASSCERLGIDYLLVGKPFGFWLDHTPAGMRLRSGVDWHVDPVEVDTIRAFLSEQGTESEVEEALSRDDFVAYLRWFVERKRLSLRPGLVTRLEERRGRFELALSDGCRVGATQVVIAPGFQPFCHQPDEVTSLLPADRSTHSSELRDPGRFRGQRLLVIGGRQSAFESAIGLAAGGAATVHVAYRHETPSFERSDWSWVKPYLESLPTAIGGLRRLDEEESRVLESRFFDEGKLKLEPWLGKRVERSGIVKHSKVVIASCRSGVDGRLDIELSDGTQLVVDHVILATGYRVDLDRLGYIVPQTLERIGREDGYPQLDDHFQSTVTGLYFAGYPAVRAFGPFFGFVVGAPCAARVIVHYLLRGS